MSSSQSRKSSLMVGWFEMEHVCPRCGCEWEDAWTCSCNDRCPDCDLECKPVSSKDFSRPLEEQDFVYAAKRIASFGHPPGFRPTILPDVGDEQAKEYAEA